MKNKYVWNVMIWRATGDEEFRVFPKKPDFDTIYPLINCDMIEFHKGYHEDHGTFEMHCDEEAKLTSKAVNKRATKAWYAWQMKTGHMSLPGDTINGDVAIVKKVQEPYEKEKEVRSVA